MHAPAGRQWVGRGRPLHPFSRLAGSCTPGLSMQQQNAEAPWSLNITEHQHGQQHGDKPGTERRRQSGARWRRKKPAAE